jgi:hypothetical protein
VSQTVTGTSEIAMSREDAWAKLQDFSLAHNYVPGIIRTQIVSDNARGIGASRYVYQSEKKYVQETVEEWHEGQGFTIRLHRGDKPAPPFRSARFTYRLDDTPQGNTLLTTSLTYEMPWGRLGNWLGGKLKPFVQQTIQDVALSMKLFYETGEPTTPEALKALKQA